MRGAVITSLDEPVSPKAAKEPNWQTAKADTVLDEDISAKQDITPPVDEPTSPKTAKEPDWKAAKEGILSSPELLVWVEQLQDAGIESTTIIGEDGATYIQLPDELPQDVTGIAYAGRTVVDEFGKEVDVINSAMKIRFRTAIQSDSTPPADELVSDEIAGMEKGAKTFDEPATEEPTPIVKDAGKPLGEAVGEDADSIVKGEKIAGKPPSHIKVVSDSKPIGEAVGDSDEELGKVTPESVKVVGEAVGDGEMGEDGKIAGRFLRDFTDTDDPVKAVGEAVGDEDMLDKGEIAGKLASHFTDTNDPVKVVGEAVGDDELIESAKDAGKLSDQLAKAESAVKGMDEKELAEGQKIGSKLVDSHLQDASGTGKDGEKITTLQKTVLPIVPEPPPPLVPESELTVVGSSDETLLEMPDRCPHCGNIPPEKSKFCNSCGKELSGGI